MTMKAISELAKDVLELPVSQRMTLARILLDLAEADQGVSHEVETEWDDEICRRLKAVETRAARARPAEEVFADLDRRFPGVKLGFPDAAADEETVRQRNTPGEESRPGDGLPFRLPAARCPS